MTEPNRENDEQVDAFLNKLTVLLAAKGADSPDVETFGALCRRES